MEPTEEDLWSQTSKKRKNGYWHDEFQEIISVDASELNV